MRDPRAGAPARILRILGRIELPGFRIELPEVELPQMKVPGIELSESRMEVPQDELHGLVYTL